MKKNLKLKTLAWVGTAVLATTLMAGQAAAAVNISSDIHGHWAEKTITDWLSKGYIKGYGDGKFMPDSTITRAEFMTIVNRAFHLDAKKQAAFSDVDSSKWYYEEVQKAYAAGYISGYSDHTIRPNQPVSRQEAAAILAKLLKLTTADPANADTINQFADTRDIPEWSRGAVGAVVKGGYMNGYPDHTFRPSKSITRAEAVFVLNAALSKGAPNPEQTSEDVPVSPPVTQDDSGVGGGLDSDENAPTPVVSNPSISGADFTGTGKNLTAAISSGVQMKDIVVDLNTDAAIQIKQVKDQNGDPVSLFGVDTTSTVSEGTSQSINLLDVLGVSALDRDHNGVSAKTICNIINGSDTGSFTIVLQLTNSNDSGKSSTYNLTVDVGE